MAEEHVKEVLEKEVTCPLCLDILQEPKKLPCDHVYCRTCLERLANRSFDTSISCPECRATTQLPNGNVSNFPTAFRLNRLIEAFHHAQEREETDCGADVPAPAKQEAMCKVHWEQPLVLYCESCKMLMCRDCVLATKDHSDHNYGFVGEMKEKLQGKLMDTASTIKGQSPHLAKSLCEISQVESDIDGCETKCQQDIDEAFGALYNTLRKSEQAMKEKVARQMNTARVGFVEKKKELLSVQSEIEAAVGQARDSLQEDDMEFLMQQFPLIEKRLEKLQEKLSKTSLTVPDRPQFIATQVVGSEALEQLLEKYNGLHPFDPTKWTASGRFPGDAEVGKPYTLTVESSKSGKFRRASSSQKGNFKLEAELVCVRDNSLTVGEVQEQSQDHFTVSVQPQSRGRHKLSIKINGVHIFNSPFDVFVKVTPRLLKQMTEVVDLQNPVSLHCSKGSLLVSEKKGNKIVKITPPSLNKTTILQLSQVEELTTDPSSGAIFTTTTNKHEVHKFTKSGELVKIIGGHGVLPGQFKFPNGLRVSQRREIFICDSCNNRIQVFDLNLNFKRSFGSAGCAVGQFSFSSDVDFDANGKIYIVDYGNHRIQVFSPDEQVLFAIGGVHGVTFNRPVSLVIHRELIYVTEMVGQRVSVVMLSGEFVASFGCGYLKEPEGIAIDDDGYVYVTSHHSKICVF